MTDYYAMLGIGPGADPETIRQALERHQAIWSSGTRNPKTRHAYQACLDQIPSIRKCLLGSPADRASYDAELAAFKRAERDRRLEDFEKLVTLKAAKGGLSSTDRRLLHDKAVEFGLDNQTVDRLINRHPLLPDPPPESGEADFDPTTAAPGEVLDPATRRQIRLALEHLKKSDLYHALGLPRSASFEEIAERADAERRKWMSKSQVTAEKTAWLEVVSHAQSQLGRPESRQRYDRTLLLEAAEAYRDLVEFVVQGLTVLDTRTREVLLEEGRHRDIGPPRVVERIIQRVCRTRGVVLEPIEPIVVPHAASGSATDNPFSPPSSAPLRESKRLANPVALAPPPLPRSVTTNGAIVGINEIQARFDAADAAYKQRDYAVALAHLDELLRLDPYHDLGINARHKVLKRLEEIERIKELVYELMARRCLIAAREAMAGWSRLVSPLDPEYEAEMSQLNEAIRRATDLATRGRSLVDTNPDEALRLFRAALERCADLPDAREGIRRCPPPPPRDLVAEYRDGQVRLTWMPPEPDGLGPIQTRLVRKRNGVPAHANDGVIITVTDLAEAIDPDPPPGELVGYAAHSCRGEAVSRIGALYGPLPIWADATDFQAISYARQVHLSWILPPGAEGVRLVRKEQADPRDPFDGVTIPAHRDRAIDTNVREDVVYHYGLFTLYRNPRRPDKLRASRGVFTTAWPRGLVETVAELRIERDERGRVHLFWDRPRKGKVQIIRTLESLGRAPGDPISHAVAKSIEGTWLPQVAADHTFDPDPPSLGVWHYTALIAYGGAFVVGAEAVLSYLADPTELRADRIGRSGKVKLRWNWGQAGTKTLLVWRLGTDPASPDDPDAQHLMIDELDYYRQGRVILSLPETPSGSTWRVRAFAVAEVGGRRQISPGLHPTSRVEIAPTYQEVELRYQLRRGWLSGGWKVVFHTTPAGSKVPPTALVSHPRAVPMTVDDGDIVDRFPAAHDGDAFPIRACQTIQPDRVRLFLDPQADPDSLAHVKLIHPQVE